MSEEIKFKGTVITKDDRQFTKDFGKDLKTFTVQIPLPYEKTAIISACSRALNGAPIESIGKERYEYVNMIITLNSVITASPNWWDGADKCPDDDFLFELWRFYLDSEKEFARRLQSKTQGKNLGTT